MAIPIDGDGAAFSFDIRLKTEFGAGGGTDVVFLLLLWSFDVILRDDNGDDLSFTECDAKEASA